LTEIHVDRRVFIRFTFTIHQVATILRVMLYDFVLNIKITIFTYSYGED